MTEQAAIWIAPTFAATLFWGLGQGLLKRNLAIVTPAQYAVFLIAAIALVNGTYYLAVADGAVWAPGAGGFLAIGVLAFMVDGLAWIAYFRAVERGPISIVGTLSAAYPVLTVVLARLFLGEHLGVPQYAGVALAILGACMLAYEPAAAAAQGLRLRCGHAALSEDPVAAAQPLRRAPAAWMPWVLAAVTLWGGANVLTKAAYGFPGADDARLALAAIAGNGITLGIYGLHHLRRQPVPAVTWRAAALPMIVMALGNLSFLIASQFGPISLVSGLSAVYPAVTIAFAALVLRERIRMSQYVGAGVVMAGIVVASLSSF